MALTATVDPDAEIRRQLEEKERLRRELEELEELIQDMNGGINGFAHSPGRVNGGPASAASSPRKSPGKADSAAWAHFEDYEKLHTAYLAQERALAEALDDIQQLTLERDTALADKVAAEKELEQLRVDFAELENHAVAVENDADILAARSAETEVQIAELTAKIAALESTKRSHEPQGDGASASSGAQSPRSTRAKASPSTSRTSSVAEAAAALGATPPRGPRNQLDPEAVRQKIADLEASHQEEIQALEQGLKEVVTKLETEAQTLRRSLATAEAERDRLKSKYERDGPVDSPKPRFSTSMKSSPLQASPASTPPARGASAKTTKSSGTAAGSTPRHASARSKSPAAQASSLPASLNVPSTAETVRSPTATTPRSPRSPRLARSPQPASFAKPMAELSRQELEDEVHWLSACLERVRETHPSLVPVPKAHKAGSGQPYLQSVKRPLYRKTPESQEKVLGYLQELGCEPSASTWHQLACLYNRCDELEAALKERSEQEDADAAARLQAQLDELRHAHASELQAMQLQLKLAESSRTGAENEAKAMYLGELEKVQFQLEEAVQERESLKELLRSEESNHRLSVQRQVDLEAEVDQLRSTVAQTQRELEARLEQEQQSRQAEVAEHQQRIQEVLDQVDEYEANLQQSRHDVDRLQASLRQAELERAQELEVLQAEHQAALSALTDGQRAALEQQSTVVRQALERLRHVAGENSSSSDVEAAMVDALRALQEAVEKCRRVDDRQRLAAVAALEGHVLLVSECFHSLRRKHQRELEEQQHQLRYNSEESSQARERMGVLSAAMAAKDAELVSAREAFAQERATHAASLRRLEDHLKSLEGELRTLSGARAQDDQQFNQERSRLLAEMQNLQSDNTKIKAQLLSKTQELESFRHRTLQERGELNASLLNDIARERDQRQINEAAQHEKLQRVSEERNRLQRELKMAESRLQALQDEVATLREQHVDDNRTVHQRLDAVLAEAQNRARQAETQAHELQTELKALESSVDHHFAEVLRGGGSASSKATTPQDKLRAIGRDLARRTLNLQAAEQQLTAEKAHRAQLVAEVEELQRKLMAKEEEALRVQAGQQEASSLRSTLGAQLQASNERCYALEREIDHLRQTLRQAEQEHAEKTADALSEYSELANAFQSVKAGFELEKENLFGQMDALRQELGAAEDVIGDLRNQVKEGDTVTLGLRGELKLMQQQKEAGEKDAVTARQLAAELELQVGKLGEENAMLRVETAEAHRLLTTLRENVDELELEAETVRRDHAALLEDYQRLQGLVQEVDAEKERLNETVRERDHLRQSQRGHDQELEQLRAAVEVLRHDKEQLNAQLLQLQNQMKREARQYTATVDDLQRQLEVIKAKNAQEREALAGTAARHEQMKAEAAKLKRDMDKLAADLRMERADKAEIEVALQSKDREASQLRRQLELAKDDHARLQAKVTSLEERSRREQQRLLADMQAQRKAQEQTLRTLERARDVSILSKQDYDRRLTQLGSQVRRLDADVRHERLDRDRLGSTDPSFNSTLNGHSQFLSSTLNASAANGLNH